MPSTPRRRPLRWALTLAGLVALVAGACTAGSATPNPGALPAPGPPTTRPATPFRVLVVGDELAAATGPALAAELEPLGTAEVLTSASPGLGLASTVDWTATIPGTAADVGADVAVLQFGGRDTPPFATSADGTPAQPGSPAWYDRWARQTRGVIDALEAAGVVTYWVTTPPVADPALDERAQAIDLALQSLSHRRSDAVRTIDVRLPYLGPDGRPAMAGSPPLRTPDGYGLTDAGADAAATLIARRLTADWCLDPATAMHGCDPDVAAMVPPAWPDDDAGDDPLDVLVVGDSLLWQAAPGLRALLEGVGARVWVEARPATGLLGDADWLGRMDDLVATLDPDVTVVQFMGQNARPDLAGTDGAPLDPTGPAYVRAFSAAASEAIERLTARGGRVAWVIGPPLAAEPLDRTLRGIALGVVQGHGNDPGVIVVDLYRALGDAAGVYTHSVGAQRLRLFDGIHYTGAGADRNARAVVAALTGAGCVGEGAACRAGATAAAAQAGASTTTNSS